MSHRCTAWSQRLTPLLHRRTNCRGFLWSADGTRRNSIFVLAGPNPAAICRSPLGRTQMQRSRRASSHGRVGCRGRLESRRRCLGLREVVRPGDAPAAHCAASTPGKSGVAPRRRHRFTEAEVLMYMGWSGCCGVDVAFWIRVRKGAGIRTRPRRNNTIGSPQRHALRMRLSGLGACIRHCRAAPPPLARGDNAGPRPGASWHGPAAAPSPPPLRGGRPAARVAPARRGGPGPASNDGSAIERPLAGARWQRRSPDGP